MSVLVTGGAGYIGSHMVLALRDRGEDVVVVDDLSTGHRGAVPDDVTLLKGSIDDAGLVRRAVRGHRVDAVAHFAGSIVVPDSVADPLGYYLNNTVRSRALIAAAVEAGVRHFIFSSTAAVYGAPAVNPVFEDAPLAPISPYGASKMMTEMMLADTARAHDFAYAALRYFNVAGADPAGRSGQSTPNATHLIKVACQAALGQREELTVFGSDYATPDGTCVRDYIHVTDLAAAHLRALDHLRAGGESLVLNCGYGRGFSVREVLAAVERAAGRPLPVREGARRPGDPDALVAGATAVRERLGWQPALDDLDLIVGHALAWERRLAGGFLKAAG
jgi:UDP-glucose 4-epimerase